MPVIAKPEVIEGTWDEISQQSARLNGHRLRVVILPDTDETTNARRLQALNEWLTMPRPEATPLLDDSRAAIYEDDEERG